MLLNSNPDVTAPSPGRPAHQHQWGVVGGGGGGDVSSLGGRETGHTGSGAPSAPGEVRMRRPREPGPTAGCLPRPPQPSPLRPPGSLSLWPPATQRGRLAARGIFWVCFAPQGTFQCPPPPPPHKAPVRKMILHTPPHTHKSVLESANPRMDSECASGCTWSTARQQPVSGTADPRSSQTGQVIWGLR